MDSVAHVPSFGTIEIIEIIVIMAGAVSMAIEGWWTGAGITTITTIEA